MAERSGDVIFLNRLRGLSTAIATAILATGCASMGAPGEGGAYSGEKSALSRAAQPAGWPNEGAVAGESVGGGPATNACLVEFRPERGRGHTKQVTLAPETTVRSVLSKAGSYSMLGNQEVYVLRRGADGNVARMNVQMQSARRGPQMESDYQVLPGDRIVVKEKMTFAFDEMIEGLAGPITSLK